MTCDAEAVWIGWIEFDLLLGDVHSLKEKRAVVKPLVNALWKQFPVAAAETGDQDLHRRVQVGATTVSGEASWVTEVLDRVERFVADRPETQLLSARRGLSNADD